MRRAIAVTLFAMLLFGVSLQAQEWQISIKMDGGVSCGNGGEFEVLSWSFGGSNSGSSVSGGKGGMSAGKVNLSDLNIMKSFDGCSAALFEALARGTQYGKVTLTQYSRGESPKAVMSLELTEARVTSYQLSGSSGGDSFPTESVSFGGRKITIKNLDTGAAFCWDTFTNRKCN